MEEVTRKLKLFFRNRFLYNFVQDFTLLLDKDSPMAPWMYSFSSFLILGWLLGLSDTSTHQMTVIIAVIAAGT